MAWEGKEPLKDLDGKPLDSGVAENKTHSDQGEKEWVESRQRNENDAE